MSLKSKLEIFLKIDALWPIFKFLISFSIYSHIRRKLWKLFCTLLQGNLVSHSLLIGKIYALSKSLLKGDWQVDMYYPYQP